MDLKELLANKKNLLGLIILIVIIIAIPLTVRLVRQQQELRSKALETDPVHFVTTNGVTLDAQGYKTTNPQVQIQLRSPLGPPVNTP